MDRYYDEMDGNNLTAFKQLYRDRFLEMLEYLIATRPDNSKEDGKRHIDSIEEVMAHEDELDDLVGLYLLDLLAKPSPVTGYAYDTEVLRKRDRAKEAIVSSPTKLQKQVAFDKHTKYFAVQTAFYVDIVSDDAAVRSMDLAGIKRVRWNTQMDNKVCDTCKARDGVIYPIDKVPGKHPRCRCWLSPVW